MICPTDLPFSQKKPMTMHYIVIRESRQEDSPAISSVVRNAYLSNSSNTWVNALFHEVTFQLIVVVAALMFIFLNVSLYYCILSIPVVLLLLYILIYSSWMMKSAQVMYEKRPLQSWVAEAYEPFFATHKPKDCTYKIIPEEKIQGEDIQVDQFHRKIIGTVAVMSHKRLERVSWLFRLAVDERYRRKGVGLHLVQTVKSWTRNNQYNYIEAAMSECQDAARMVFAKAGFDAKQIYHKKIVTNTISLQMFQLKCEVRPNLGI